MGALGRLPNEDQGITAVTVREGRASVLSGRILVAKDRGIVARFDADGGGVPERGQIVTLLYAGAERILRLRTRVSEIIDGDGPKGADKFKLLLEPEGVVTEGERREFLRSETPVDIRAERVGADATDVVGRTVSTPWERQVADLSGSGVSFLSDIPADRGDLLFVQLVLATTASPVVNCIAEVIRAQPEEGRIRLAVHYRTVDERDRDVLINHVFRRHYEQLGSKLGAAFEPDA